MSKQKALLLLLSGILGCLCFGCGDWLMIYADHTAHGALFWLTEGTAQIAPWRNTLAMALAFPGIIFTRWRSLRSQASSPIVIHALLTVRSLSSGSCRGWRYIYFIS